MVLDTEGHILTNDHVVSESSSTEGGANPQSASTGARVRASIWQGVLAPAGTPNAIVEKLNREFGAALASADVKKKFFAAGVEAMPSTPAQFRSYIESEIAKWAKVIKASGAKVD